jgi:hypothetical protein
VKELEHIIRDIIRAVLKERGIEVVANEVGAATNAASTRSASRSGVPRELSRFERASLAMQENASPGTAAINASALGAFVAVPAPDAAPVSPSQTPKTIARVLTAVCCGECLSESARVAVSALERNGFALSQPAEDELKKRAPREAMIANHDVVLLPAVGDDDAAKMAAGIFDEPVTRTALAALASGVPVYIILHAPYAEALRRGSPNLARVLESNRRALQTLGFNIVEANSLGSTLRARFASTRNGASTETHSSGVTFGANFRGLNGGANGANAMNFVASTRSANAGDGAMQNGAGRTLITAQDIDRAAASGEALNLSNAIITPLARDRARELNFALGV